MKNDKVLLKKTQLLAVFKSLTSYLPWNDMAIFETMLISAFPG